MEHVYDQGAYGSLCVLLCTVCVRALSYILLACVGKGEGEGGRCLRMRNEGNLLE